MRLGVSFKKSEGTHKLTFRCKYSNPFQKGVFPILPCVNLLAAGFFSHDSWKIATVKENNPLHNDAPILAETFSAGTN